MIQALQYPAITMSSREIASVVKSRHADVIRSIERLIASGTIDRYAPTAYTHAQNGQQYQEYFVSKRDSYVVVAQMSPAFTAALVDRWQELEFQHSKIPKSFADALRLAADQQELIEKQQALIEHQKPAVEFVGRYVEAGNTKSIREVAKTLGIPERQFIDRLTTEGVLFRAVPGGPLLPYSVHQKKGYFSVKAGEANGHAYGQTRFTSEGITWIAKRLHLVGASTSINKTEIEIH